LDSLAHLKAADLVTERPEKHVDYEVDAGHGERVKVFTAGGLVLDMVLGKSAARGGFYVRRGEDPHVYLTGTQLGWLAKKSATELRRKSLVSLTAGDLREITLVPAGGTSYTLGRADAAKPWEITAGKPDAPGFRFDTEMASRTAQAVTELRAQDFIAPGKASDEQLGFHGAHAQVKAKPATGDAVELELGRPANADDARFASLLRAQLEKLDAAGNKDGKLQLDELKAAAAQAKDQPAKDAAAALSGDSARFAWFDGGGWELHTPDGALSPEDLDAVSKNGGLVPVRVAGAHETALVPSWSTEALTRPALALRDLSLFSFAVTKAEGLTLLGAGGKTTVALKHENNTWKLEEPKKWTRPNPFDPNRVLFRIGDMRRWRALRVAEGVSDAQAGLNSPVATVRVTAPEGTQVLRLGKPVPGRTPAEHYAKGAVDALVYVVGDGLRATLAEGPALFEKAPTPVGPPQGLDSLPPEVRRKLEALRASGAPQ
jgi:hypothetical protein